MAAPGVAATLAAIIGLVLCGLGSKAQAQDWSLKSQLAQKVTYNTNLLLTPSNKVSAFGSVTTPELTLARVGPTSSISLDGAFEFSEYFDHSELNTQDQTVRLRSEKQFSERSKVNFDANFSRDTTLTSDLDVDGRFLNKPVRFITWDAQPTWTYQLSPIDEIAWSGSYLSKDYQSSQKTDYQQYGTALNYSHALSELAAVTGSLSYFQFRPDGARIDHTDTWGGLIGYRYNPTERFKISGNVGLDYSVSEGNAGTKDESELGYRAKFDMDYKVTEQALVKVSLSHDAEPSGDGLQVTRNRGTVYLNYEVSPTVSLGLLGVYVDNQDYFSSSGAQNDSETSRFWLVGPNLTWNLLEDLDLTTGYQFRRKVASGNGGSASDNSVFVTLRYRLPDLAWSGF
jgi:hypothetical protein